MVSRLDHRRDALRHANMMRQALHALPPRDAAGPQWVDILEAAYGCTPWARLIDEAEGYRGKGTLVDEEFGQHLGVVLLLCGSIAPPQEPEPKKMPAPGRDASCLSTYACTDRGDQHSSATWATGEAACGDAARCARRVSSLCIRGLARVIAVTVEEVDTPERPLRMLSPRERFLVRLVESGDGAAVGALQREAERLTKEARKLYEKERLKDPVYGRLRAKGKLSAKGYRELRQELQADREADLIAHTKPKPARSRVASLVGGR